MTEFVQQFFTAIQQYYSSFTKGHLADWWLPMVAVGGVYLLGIVILRLTRVKPPLTRVYSIARAIVIAGSLGALILIAWFCGLWAVSSYYPKQQTQLLHLIALLLVFIINAVVFFFLKKRSSQRDKNELLYQPIAMKERQNFETTAVTAFNRLKIWILLPIFGMVALLLDFYKPPALISVILDNSSSMENHIETGKLALSKTFRELDDKCDIIVGWFTEKNPKKSVAQILRETNYRNLEGENYYLTNKYSAIQILQRIPNIGGTPLCEEIWANYLFARENSLRENYQTRILIIVSDGAGNLMTQNALESFFCSNVQFSDFFTEVSCINLGGDLNSPFFTKATQCGYYIEEDGTTLESYSAALNTILAGVKKDKYFIYWILFLYLISVLIILPLSGRRS